MKKETKKAKEKQIKNNKSETIERKADNRIKWNKTVKDHTLNAKNGVVKAIKTELNLKLEIIFAILAITLAIVLKVTKVELLLVIFVIGQVIVAELINTAIEEIVDMKTTTYNNKIKYIKDVMAGAVLFSVIVAAVTGYIVFFERLYIMFCIVCRIGY